MQKYEIKTKDQKTVGIEIEEPHPTFKSCFAFGIYKGGSTLLFDLLTAICHEYHGIPYVSIPDAVFIKEGLYLKDIELSSLAPIYSQEGYCFGGFRQIRLLSPWIHEFLLNHPKMVLLRDPRDILVSLYFSEKYSHQIPEKATELQQSRQVLQNLEIEQFVLQRKERFKIQLSAYNEIEDWDQVKIFRYEDVILCKRQWINEICEFLELPLNDDQIQSILDRYDVIPSSEDPNRHIRRVVPGDHQEKLSPETIKQLNETFCHFLSKYNYEV